MPEFFTTRKINSILPNWVRTCAIIVTVVPWSPRDDYIKGTPTTLDTRDVLMLSWEISRSLHLNHFLSYESTTLAFISRASPAQCRIFIPDISTATLNVPGQVGITHHARPAQKSFSLELSHSCKVFTCQYC